MTGQERYEKASVAEDVGKKELKKTGTWKRR